jgi:apolipoprotein D and lipocalin family protein
MKSTIIKFILVLLATLSAHHTLEASTTLSLQTVEYVDLNRYSGVWYDVAHYPNKFQENCQDGTTIFSMRKDGEIDIHNSCHDNMTVRCITQTGVAG